MKLKQLFEQQTKGSYAGVRYHKDSVNRLVGYIRENNIPNPVPEDKIHSTLLYSRKHLPKYQPYGEYNPPMEAIPKEFVVWNTKPKEGETNGSRCLVLSLDCPELITRHHYLMDEHEATYDFPEYVPHITMSYDIGDFDHNTLPPTIFSPDYHLNVVEEYGEDLDLNWADKL